MKKENGTTKRAGKKDGGNGHPRPPAEAIKNTPAPERKRLFDGTFARTWTDADIEKLADDLYLWFTEIPEGKQNNQQFWIKDFCIPKGVHQQRLSEWRASNDYFAYVYALCKDIQESRLVRMGIMAKSNPAFYIFTLKNVAEWSDKKEIKASGVLDDSLSKKLATLPLDDLRRIAFAELGLAETEESDENG